MADEGIEINDEILNGRGPLFNSSFVQSDNSCMVTPTEDELVIVQLPDTADAGIEVARDKAETDFEEHAGSVASKMTKKKKCVMVLVASVALFAVGLGAGLGTKNGNKSVSSASNAVTVEDCLDEEQVLEDQSILGITLIPTWMPTTPLPTNEAMAFSLSAETKEEESTTGTIGVAPVGYSNDFAGMMLDAQNSDDASVRRDLRGSNISRSAANKVHELKASSKSRRLQCDELLADRTSSSSGDSSKSDKSIKSSKGLKSSSKAGKQSKSKSGKTNQPSSTPSELPSSSGLPASLPSSLPSRTSLPSSTPSELPSSSGLPTTETPTLGPITEIPTYLIRHGL